MNLPRECKILLSVAVFLLFSGEVKATLVPSAANFAVRINEGFNPTGLPGIYGLGDEAFVEFNLGFGPATSVTFNFISRDFTTSIGDPPPGNQFDVHAYAGNGLADLSDFGSGVLLATLTNSTQLGNTNFALDVTSLIAELQFAGATHVGFRFSNVTPPDQLNLLDLNLSVSTVPTPSTLMLLGSGVVSLLLFMRYSNFFPDKAEERSKSPRRMLTNGKQNISGGEPRLARHSIGRVCVKLSVVPDRALAKDWCSRGFLQAACQGYFPRLFA